MNRKTQLTLILAAAFAATAAHAHEDAAADAATAAAAGAAEQAESARQVRRHVEVVRAQAAAQAVVAAEAHAHAMDMQGNVAFMRMEMNQGPVVKGAPYCADAVHETVQALADGNRIVRSQSTRLCRDGEGRTRQEVEREGRRSVFLRDPVSKESWVLDSERKTALKIGMPSGPAIDHGAMREYAERMREWAQKVKEQVRANLGREGHVPPLPPVPPAPPEPALITQSDETFKDAQGRERREVRVLRINNNNGGVGATPAPPHAPHPPLAPPAPMRELEAPLAPQAVLTRALHFAPRGPGVVSPLGGKEIEGMKVNGERTTWTIEAGKVGNEKPIVITRDVWTSPELSITVATRDFDPRSGEVNYRLQGLKRGEPDPALMKVPADYAAKGLRTPAPARSQRPAASAPALKG